MEHLLEIGREQDQLQRQLNVLTESLTEKVARRVVLQKKVADLDRYVAECQRKLQAEQRRLQVVAQKRNEAEARRSTYAQQLATLQAKVDVAVEHETKLMASLAPQDARLEQILAHQKHWEFWKTAVPNLRASAMEEVLGYLNDRLAFYMDIFSSGAMGVRLYQETYGKGTKIRVEMKTPAEVYDLSSGGEKRRVDLALYLSLSDLLQTTSGMACNLLAADEICDGLSPVGVRQFLDVLKVLAQAGRCVFVMSHNSAVASQFEFDSVIVVERREGRALLRTTS
jgi:DNA repair exonuclease SbcCD ATPase subunit